MSHVKILIAEDDEDDFLHLKEAISEVLPKFHVHHAEDGRELLRSIDQGIETDLIFLDLNMPYVNGIDCLIEIRKRKHLDSTPVVIYSTSSDFEEIDKCYKNGCTLYLVKPSSYREVINQVKKVFFRLGLPQAELQDKEKFIVQVSR